MNIELIDAVPGFEFWRDGCRAFAKSICTVLALAESDLSKEDVLRFIHTMPRVQSQLLSPEWKEGYCYQCLEKAHAGSPKDVDYFLTYFVDRGFTAQRMLIDAFVGFMLGVDEAEKEGSRESAGKT